MELMLLTRALQGLHVLHSLNLPNIGLDNHKAIHWQHTGPDTGLGTDVCCSTTGDG